MLDSTFIVLCLPTRKLWTSARLISRLQPKVKTYCKGAYASFRLRTDMDGNCVDTVANVDSSDSICISVR